MEESETFTKLGKFLVAPGKEAYGELRVAGKDTLLFFQDDRAFRPFMGAADCVTGTLHDLTKVSLLDCLVLENSFTASRDGQESHRIKMFPHFVLAGRCHITPNDKSISHISVALEDAAVLFYDFDAFGTVIDSSPYIEELIAANKLERAISIGPHPVIAYFTGKREIVQAETSIGRVSAQHNPSGGLGGPDGVRIGNIITVTLEPECPVEFNDAISRMLRLVMFLELVIGRPQNLRALEIIVPGDEHPERLKVHWSNRPIRSVQKSDHAFTPHPGTLLLDPIHRRDEFIDVMRGWLEKDDERQDARSRFHTSFALQNQYSVERLIGAANMFDILPASAVPRDVELAAEVLDAIRRSRSLFQALPNSYERSSLLNALGRQGKAALKHKTKHRAQHVIQFVGERFPDLVSVLDAAIDCRNHYVHGSPSKLDYSRNFDQVIFFTNTLEFVFGASELIEAGWDIRSFLESSGMSHPYSAYRVSFSENLQVFKALIGES